MQPFTNFDGNQTNPQQQNFYYGGGDPFGCNMMGMGGAQADSRRNFVSPMMPNAGMQAAPAPGMQAAPAPGMMGFNQLVDSRRTQQATANTTANPWAQQQMQMQPPIAPPYGGDPYMNMNPFNPYGMPEPDLSNSKSWWKSFQQQAYQPYYKEPQVQWPSAQQQSMMYSQQPTAQYPVPMYPNIQESWYDVARKNWGDL